MYNSQCRRGYAAETDISETASPEKTTVNFSLNAQVQRGSLLTESLVGGACISKPALQQPVGTARWLLKVLSRLVLADKSHGRA